MEVQDQESLGRWDGLGSRDASSRSAAMEHIGQEVMKKVEAIGPIPASPPLPPALGSLPNSDLNDILAHLLMLSRRCPFEDVKERCIRLLKAVQVGDSYSLYETMVSLFVLNQHQAVIRPLILGLMVLFCCHLPLFTSL